MAIKNVNLGAFVLKIENAAYEADQVISATKDPKKRKQAFDNFYSRMIKEAEGSWKQALKSEVFDVH